MRARGESLAGWAACLAVWLAPVEPLPAAPGAKSPGRTAGPSARVAHRDAAETGGAAREGEAPIEGSAAPEAPALPEIPRPRKPRVRRRPFTAMERQIEILRRVLGHRILEAFPGAEPLALSTLTRRLTGRGADETDELEAARRRADALRARGTRVPGYGIVLFVEVQVREGAKEDEEARPNPERPLWERIEEEIASLERGGEGGRSEDEELAALESADLEGLASEAGRPTWKELADLILSLLAEHGLRLASLPAGESVIVVAHRVEGSLTGGLSAVSGADGGTSSPPEALALAVRKADLEAFARGEIDRATLAERAVVALPPPPPPPPVEETAGAGHGSGTPAPAARGSETPAPGGTKAGTP